MLKKKISTVSVKSTIITFFSLSKKVHFLMRHPCHPSVGGNLDIPIRSVPCLLEKPFFFGLIFSTVLFDTYLIKLNVQTYQNFYFFSRICPSFPLLQCDLWVWMKVQKIMYHWEKGLMVYRGEFGQSCPTFCDPHGL